MGKCEKMDGSLYQSKDSAKSLTVKWINFRTHQANVHSPIHLSMHLSSFICQQKGNSLHVVFWPSCLIRRRLRLKSPRPTWLMWVLRTWTAAEMAPPRTHARMHASTHDKAGCECRRIQVNKAAVRFHIGNVQERRLFYPPDSYVQPSVA